MAITAAYDPAAPVFSEQGAAVGNFEQLGPTAHIIEPLNAPFLAMLETKDTKQMKLDWLADVISDPDDTPIIEGSDVTNFEDVYAGQFRLTNYCQIFRRPVQVSDEQNASASAGPNDYAEAVRRAHLALNRDTEKALLADNNYVAATGSQGWRTRGLYRWLNNASDLPTEYQTPSDSIHTAGAFTEDDLQGLLRSIYEQSMDVQSLIALVDTNLRLEMTNFAFRDEGATNYTRNVNYKGIEAKLAVTLEIYKGDFGEIKLMNSNPKCSPDATNKDVGFLINPRYVCLRQLIPTLEREIPNTGGAQKGYVKRTCGLEVGNPLAHGLIQGLS